MRNTFLILADVIYQVQCEEYTFLILADVIYHVQCEEYIPNTG